MTCAPDGPSLPPFTNGLMASLTASLLQCPRRDTGRALPRAMYGLISYVRGVTLARGLGLSMPCRFTSVEMREGLLNTGEAPDNS